MTEDFVVPATGKIEYQYFEIPVTVSDDKWVSAIEIDAAQTSAHRRKRTAAGLRQPHRHGHAGQRNDGIS